MDRFQVIQRMDLLSDAEVASLKALGPQGRLRMMDRMVGDGIALMRARVRNQNPGMNEEQIARLVTQRLANAPD